MANDKPGGSGSSADAPVTEIWPGANPAQHELFELARKGKDAWNTWRGKYPAATVDFSRIDFSAEPNNTIDFSGFRFGDEVIFNHATFGPRARFTQTKFGNKSRFEGATFGHFAQFIEAEFGNEALFNGATLGIGTCFDHATFGDDALFVNTMFQTGVRFDGAFFQGTVNFADSAGRVPFREISFARAHFIGVAKFEGRQFNREAIFAGASFHQPPDFSGTTKCEMLDLTGARFAFGDPGKRRYWSEDTNVAVRLRRLRKIASDIKAHDIERDLFILERKAERGIFWKQWLEGKKCNDWFLFHALWATVSMTIYSLLSDCGRSVSLPFAWLITANIMFGYIYESLATTITFPFKNLFAFTISHLVPFFGVTREAYSESVKALFGDLTLPVAVQTLAWGQGILNGLLIFLLGLAIRNHFRVGSS